jgi:hypothetical protein
VHALGTDAEDASSVGAGELNSLTALVADKTSRKYSKSLWKDQQLLPPN